MPLRTTVSRTGVCPPCILPVVEYQEDHAVYTFAQKLIGKVATFTHVSIEAPMPVEQVAFALEQSHAPLLIVPFNCSEEVRDVVAVALSQHGKCDVKWAVHPLPNVEGAAMCGSMERIAPFPQSFAERAALVFPGWGWEYLSFTTPYRRGFLMCSGGALPSASSVLLGERQQEMHTLIQNEDASYQRYLAVMLCSVLFPLSAFAEPKNSSLHLPTQQ